jgi:hypothetical protein
MKAVFNHHHLVIATLTSLLMRRSLAFYHRHRALFRSIYRYHHTNLSRGVPRVLCGLALSYTLVNYLKTKELQGLSPASLDTLSCSRWLVLNSELFVSVIAEAYR